MLNETTNVRIDAKRHMRMWLLSKYILKK